MTSFGEQSSGAAARIGEADRQEALTALTAHREAGRLDDVGFESRESAARAAQTWADLVPLFADLPDPRPAKVTALAAYGTPGAAPPPATPHLPIPAPPEVAAAGNRLRETVMALVPFVALILFFTAGYNWIWFLMIPVAGILLYGPGGRPKKPGR